MPYMAQQWVETAVREAFRERSDPLEAADRAAGVRAWLESLPLDGVVVAALAEPIAALEAGLRAAARDGARDQAPGTSGDGPAAR